MADIILKNNPEQTLNEIAKSSVNSFNNSVWPMPSEEEWRRTRLSGYDLNGFSLNFTKNKASTMTMSTDKISRNGFSLHIRKVPGSSAVIAENENNSDSVVIYGPSCSEKMNDKSSRLIGVLAEYAFSRMDNKTGYLALSSFKDSLFVIIPDNLRLSKPIIVEFDAPDSNETFLPNLFVSVGKNAEVQLIQKITAADGSNISGSITVIAADKSSVKTATVMDTGENSIVFMHRYFKLLEKVVLDDFQSCNQGELVKLRTELELTGEKSDAHLYGIVISGGSSHIDLRTVQHHRAKDCTSQALIKTVVSDRARSIYQGLIEVEEEASLTDAYLTNNNIVLNDGSRADSIPSLKIRNNDVKCSHGSTTGRIDDNQVLYLRSRGLSEDEARQMILEGFLNQVYDLLSEEIKSFCYPFIMDRKKTKEAVY